MHRTLAEVVQRLRRSPAYVFFFVTTLVLGIAPLASAFALARQTVFVPLGVASPDSLVTLIALSRGPDGIADREILSRAELDAFQSLQNVFEGVAGFAEFQEGIASPGEQSELVLGELVTGAYFNVARPRIALGRPLLQSDDHPDAKAVVVVSEAFWRLRLGGAPAIIGTNILLNGHSLEIVGIADSSFRGLNLPSIAPTRLWVPLDVGRRFRLGGERRARQWTQDEPSLNVIARVREGTSPEMLRGILAGVRVAVDVSPFGAQSGYRTVLGVGLAERRARHFGRRVATVVFGLAILVVVAICANLASLLIARTVFRRADYAIRSALGCSRLRLFLVFMAETAVLGAIAGIIVVLSVTGATEWMTMWLASNSGSTPISISARMDVRVLLATMGVALASALIIALPATRAAVRIPLGILSSAFVISAARSEVRLRRWLLGVQLAVMTAIVCLAVLFAKTAIETYSRDIGISGQGVAAVAVDLSRAGYDGVRSAAFFRSVKDRLAQSQLTSLSVVDLLPVGTRRTPVEIRSADSADQSVNGRTAVLLRVAPGYFDTVKTRILHGREFDARDGANAAPVAIVSSHAARILWGTTNVIGRRVQIERGEAETFDIVGVAADTDVRFFGERRTPAVYVAFAQSPATSYYLIAPATGVVPHAIAVIRHTIFLAEPRAVVLEAAELQNLLNRWVLPHRVVAVLVVLLAVTAILVCVTGLYGTVWYAAEQRRREIALRIALGGTRTAVSLAIIREVRWPFALGIVVGAFAAFQINRLIGTGVFGFSPLSFPVLVPAVAVATFCCLLAASLPAWTACSGNVNSALREA